MATHFAMTSIENKSTSDSSMSSSNVNVFGIIENENDFDLHGKSSESITMADSQKLTVAVKTQKVKEGVWESYYHCLAAIIMANNIHYWVPGWYYRIHMSQGFLAIHFILIMLFIHLPINYMEMFLAQYTKEPPINLWKVCPIFVGYCYSLIAYSALQSWLDTVHCGRNLLYLMETVFDRAPWLRCPLELGRKCLVLTDETKLSKKCRIAGNSTLIWCPDRGTFDFSAQHWFKSRYEVGAGDNQSRLDTQWKLVLCSIAHWLFVLLSVVRTIYKFGTMIYCLAFAVIIFAVIDLTYTLSNVNVTDLIRIAFRPPQLADFVNEEFWAVAYIATIWRAHVTTPPLIMTFVARVESKFDVAWCAVIITFASFFFMLLKSTARGGLMHIIADKLNVNARLLSLNNASSALALMPQHFGTLPMPLMWTFYWFAMRYALLWLQSTMVVQAILENFFLKHNVRKEFRIYFISLFCVAGCIVNVIIIVKDAALPFMYVIYSRIIFAGISMMPLVESIFIFLIYGLGAFVNDIHFTFGSPPSFFWRFCWKALPFTLLTLYLTTLISNLNKPFPPLNTPLWFLRGALLAIIPVFALKQIMYAVYNDNLAYLFNPVFDWGPRDKEVRKARKRFNPIIDIRSQPERAIGYVKPRDLSRDLNIE